MSNRGRHKKFEIKGNWIHKVLPQSTLKLMLKRQREQGNFPNIKIFENQPSASRFQYGFNWSETSEGFVFWNEISTKIECYKNHQL